MMTDLKPGKPCRDPPEFRWAALLPGIVTVCLTPTAHAQLDSTSIRTLNNNLANDAVSAVEIFASGNTIATSTFTRHHWAWICSFRDGPSRSAS